MIRRRGISLLTVALVFLVFGAFTVLRLPGTPSPRFQDVTAEKAVHAENLQQTEETQEVFEGGTAGAEQAMVEEDEGGLAEVPDDSATPVGDIPVSMDESASRPSTDDGIADTPEDAPVRTDGDSGSQAETTDADIAGAKEEDDIATDVGGTAEDDLREWEEAAVSAPPHETIPATSKDEEAEAPLADTMPDTTSTAPLPSETLKTHPIAQLVQQAADDHAARLSRQSKTLKDAVSEYTRRYGMPPPPHFDKWFALAQSRNISLPDEFDTLHASLLPFWGLSPATIRRRATEALGYANNLQGMLIRDGQVALQTGGKEWERDALREMVSGFVALLPDMDLVFNALDEPRVALPHEDLAALVARGRQAQARASGTPSNNFTRAADLGDGTSIPEVPTSRFVYVGHQSSWAISRLSCPPSSPARSLDDDDDAAADDTSYCATPLCFVANATAHSDVCSTPSLRRTHGFFDRPNSLSVSHDLVPIFSPSKLSSFQDIVFPATWYWAGRVPYNASADVPWAAKDGQLYWRGSTTGGFSRWGGWRRHHRQRAIQRLNDDERATAVLAHRASNSSGEAATWTYEPSSVSRHAHLLNATFTHVGQCDPGDCAAQTRTLPLGDRAPQHAAFAHRFLLDMDGNAFSGRFQAFLRSASLVLKMAVFREWSAEWVVPWRDFVPLSLRGGEWVEAVRYLEGEGASVAEGLAAGKGVGREEMEVWFFRLLLEYVLFPLLFPLLIPFLCCSCSALTSMWY